MSNPLTAPATPIADCTAEDELMTISAADQERIGRALFEKMEHLDPETRREWSELSVREKDYFWLCAEAVLMEAAMTPLVDKAKTL